MATVKERHPEVYIEHHEDPRSRARKVAMEVFSFGFSRTGTMSMKAAFETLGIPTWHWVSMCENPSDMAMWREALEAKFKGNDSSFGQVEFDSLLSNWGATTDQPACVLAEELLIAYPNAKVVLVERDADRWLKSFKETVIQGTANPFIPFLTLIDKVYIGQMAAITDLVARYYFRVAEPRTRYRVFNNPRFFSEWEEKAKEGYQAHIEMIKRITPPERLLLFKLDEGWEPLCKFLGKKIPSRQFPKVNETQAAQEMINAYITEGYKRSMIKLFKRVAPIGVVILAAVVVWKLK